MIILVDTKTQDKKVSFIKKSLIKKPRLSWKYSKNLDVKGFEFLNQKNLYKLFDEIYHQEKDQTGWRYKMPKYKKRATEFCKKKMLDLYRDILDQYSL